MKTKNLSNKTIKEALKVACGLYRMNATTALGYAFTKNQKNNGIACGEFVHTWDSLAHHDGFISFRYFEDVPYLKNGEEYEVTMNGDELLDIKGLELMSLHTGDVFPIISPT